MNIVFFIVCLLVLGISSYTDIKRSTIPNQVFYPVLALAVTVPFVYGVWNFLLRVAIVILIFFCYEGMVKGGDAKLLMMITMLGSPIKAVVTLGIASIIMLAVTFVIEPEKTKDSLWKGYAAIRSFDPKQVAAIKGKGQTMILAPGLLVGFVIATIIFGI